MIEAVTMSDAQELAESLHKRTSSPTFAEIWATLSNVDVSKHVKKVNRCSYLSWAWAWGVLMEHYPEATYYFHDDTVHPDGTVTVNCGVTIGSCDRSMWLPVMTGYQHCAKPNPDARDISDCRMRCLVKCLALFGLGHYIYAGEDLPTAASPPTAKDEALESKPITEDTETLLYELADLMDAFPNRLIFESFVLETAGQDISDMSDERGKKTFKWLKGNPDPETWPAPARLALANSIAGHPA